MVETLACGGGGGMAPDLSFDSSFDDADVVSQHDANSCDDAGEVSASLDTLIFTFRASSNKLDVEDRGDSRTPPSRSPPPPRTPRLRSLPPRSPSLSPPRTSKFKAARTGDHSSRSKPAPKPTAKARFTQRRQTSDDSDQDEEAVRPMPKLTQIPKPKPSLIQLPRSKLLEIPKPTVPSRHTRAPLPVSPPPTRHRKFQPIKMVPAKAESSASSALSTPSPLSSPSSLSSPRAKRSPSDLNSSGIHSDSSIDNLIGNDINKLSRLISSAHDLMRDSGDNGADQRVRARHSPTADEMTAALAQRTRFRKGKFDFKNKIATSTTTAKRSSGAAAPQLAKASKTFPFSKLQLPTRRPRFQHDDDGEASPPPPPPPLDESNEDDSFAEEILRLRRAARKQKEEREKAAASKQKNAAATAQSPEPKEISEETTATIREVSLAIDEALLLALQPLERRRKELDTEEAATAAAAASEAPAEPLIPPTLPLATQAIVEQLDLAFGSMTEQRTAELKAAEDSAAVAKAAEDAAKAEAEAKKQADERAEKQREMEILRLLPMRGKLMATSADVDDALHRLERAENEAAHTLHVVAGSTLPREGGSESPPAQTLLVDELARLQMITMQRMEAIERSLDQQQRVPDRVNWNRSAFEAKEAAPAQEALDTTAYVYSDDSSGDTREYASLHDILQQHVVEKLDLTILKLRHVLSIDEKEAAEAKIARAREEQALLAKKQEEEKEAARKKQELDDAAAARRRVMGLSSIEQVRAWVDGEADDDTQLHASLANARALDRLVTSLDLRVADSRLTAPSYLDSHAAIARFDALRDLVSAKATDEHDEQPASPSTQWLSRNQRLQESDTSSDEDDAITHKQLQRVRFEPEDDGNDSHSRRVRRNVDRETSTPTSQQSQRRRLSPPSTRRDDAKPTRRSSRAVVARVQQQFAQLQAERRQKTSAWRARFGVEAGVFNTR